MSRIVAIVNQKGGVGKSTTAVNLGAYLAEAGRKVLLIDIDPQGNATSGVGLEKIKIKHCMYDVLLERLSIAEVIMPTAVKGLDAAPASIALAGAEVELVAAISREFRLRTALRPVIDKYDILLIDSPPSLGLLTVNSLAAADGVLIPIQCEYYALEGLSQLMQTIELIKNHLNPNLVIDGVVMTMFDSRTNLSQQVTDDVRGYFDTKVKVFDTVIPRNVRLSEAPSYGQPINIYDNKCRGAVAYSELAKEVLSQWAHAKR
jgi:chromosome partitioning protein